MRAILFAALAVTTACHKVTYVNPTLHPNGTVMTDSGHFWLFGTVGHKDVYADRMCPTGVSRIQSRYTFGDALIGVLTLRLYQPRTYEVECGQ